MEQLSIWDISIPKLTRVEAKCCMDGSRTEAHPPDAFMLDMVPTAKYVVDVGGHNLVLSPETYRENEIRTGHQFYHYLIEGKVYSGIFVGTKAKER